MRPVIQEFNSSHTPESLTAALRGQPGVVLLRSGLVNSETARYSFVTARPFLTFRAWGSRCEIRTPVKCRFQFGNPWQVLNGLAGQYELLEQLDLPFPLGGCFGYWGFELKHFVEPKLSQRAVNDLELPDCSVGFYDSLVAFDHHLGKCWIIATGLQADATRSAKNAEEQKNFWQLFLSAEPVEVLTGRKVWNHDGAVESSLSRADYLKRVEQALRYIRQGDIYQVNLSHRLTSPLETGSWSFYQRLAEVSPAPFSAYLDCGDFQVASSSPELFLRMSGVHITTRPIKGTRPRSADSMRDAQLAYELQTSAKERAELVMITDLLRNDLGRVCEYGSVQVPELMRLEKYPQVQHLVATVTGDLRGEVPHIAALASCFPGGSISGAPKIRALDIIDELEPVTRGPYTGALGYIGFNRESQLSIAIRVAVCRDQRVWFHVGAGIVADSRPAEEYDETIAKAGGFLNALNIPQPREIASCRP